MKVLILLAAIIGIALCRPHVGEITPSSDIETPIVDDDNEDSSSSENDVAVAVPVKVADDGIEQKPEIPDVSSLSLEDIKNAPTATEVAKAEVSTDSRFVSTPLAQSQQDFTVLNSASYIPPDQSKPEPEPVVPAVPLSDTVITTVKKEDGYHYAAPAVAFSDTGRSPSQSPPITQQTFVAQPQFATNGFVNTASQYTSVSAPSPASNSNGFVNTASQYTSVSAPSPARYSNDAAEQVVGNVEIVQQEMRELAPIVEYVMQNYQTQPQQYQFQQTQQFQQSQQQPSYYQAAQQQDYLPPPMDYLPPSRY